jgi:hypothetical protein
MAQERLHLLVRSTAGNQCRGCEVPERKRGHLDARREIGPVRDVHSDDPVFVSGESAAEDLLRPATLTLYVEELDPRLPVVNKWRSNGPANIVVRR